MPILPRSQHAQNNQLISFDPINDQMLSTGMDADGRIEFWALTGHLWHEEQPIERIFYDIGIAVGLRHRPRLCRVKPDVFQIALGCWR